MEKDRKTLILIPAFNEEKNIKQVISDIKQLWSEAYVLVVNDGSVDDTASIALKAGAEVISLPFNSGYGVALQTGYKYALEKGYQYLLQMDGDGQHDPVYIHNLLKPVKSGETDLAIGSRFTSEKENGTYKAGFIKRTGMKIFAVITSVLIGQKITDATSGYQAMNSKVLKFFSSDIYPVDFPDADVLIMLNRAGFRIKEVPVAMHQNGSNQYMHHGMVSFYYVFKMFLSIFLDLLRKIPKELSS
jgi:glycosyltransferase involved in cell wall biosynthesis